MLDAAIGDRAAVLCNVSYSLRGRVAQKSLFKCSLNILNFEFVAMPQV